MQKSSDAMRQKLRYLRGRPEPVGVQIEEANMKRIEVLKIDRGARLDPEGTDLGFTSHRRIAATISMKLLHTLDEWWRSYRVWPN